MEESSEIVPGVRSVRVGVHTPGLLMVEVAGRSGEVVIASDSVHFLEEMMLDRPFYAHTDLVGMYRAYEVLRMKASTPNTWIVSGHDPIEMERFERVNEHCVDLTRPV